jgi:hypothetical protein
MRTLGFSLCGFSANVSVPDEFFDERGVPRWHLLNARFSSPSITWNTPIGGVPVDEPVVSQQQVPTIGEELQRLREVVATLEKKFDGVVP